MKRLFFTLTTIIFFTMVFISITYAGDIIYFTYAGSAAYFDSDGREINKEQYENIVAERRENIATQKKQQKTVSDTQVDIDDNDSYEKTVERDYLGRPLKTRDGLWITYPGEEGSGTLRHNSNVVITKTKSYWENSNSMRKEIDAQRADQYRVRYIKSGKITDLHKYREAMKEYYND